MLDKAVISQLVEAVVSNKITARSYFFIVHKLGVAAPIALAALLAVAEAEAAIKTYERSHPEEFGQISFGRWPDEAAKRSAQIVPEPRPAEGASEQQPAEEKPRGNWDNFGNWDNWSAWYNDFDNWGNWSNNPGWGNWNN